MKVLYAIGDSNVWGGELHNKEQDRSSKLLSNKLDLIEWNVATAGISNDRIYRVTVRDVSRFLNKEKVWCELYGDMVVEDMFVVIGWTSPTRFEYIDHETGVYVQRRNWKGDRWGFTDKNKIDETELVLNFADTRFAYTRIFNQMITLHHFLKSNNIKHLFYNCFWNWDMDINEKVFEKIDNTFKNKVVTDYDTSKYYYSLSSLWANIPQTYKDLNHFEYLRGFDKDLFYERGHPNEEGHKLWAEKLYSYIRENEI